VKRQATKQTSWRSWCSQPSVSICCWFEQEIIHAEIKADLEAVIFTAFGPRNGLRASPATLLHPSGSLLPCLCLLSRLRPCPSTLMLLLPLLPRLSSSSRTAEALRGTLTSTCTSLRSPVGDVGARWVKLLRANGLRPLRTAEEPGW
jgi:hypothetical protein